VTVTALERVTRTGQRRSLLRAVLS